jgi:hypothetical protein
VRVMGGDQPRQEGVGAMDNAPRPRRAETGSGHVSRLGRGARVAISDVRVVAGRDDTASLLAGRGADAQHDVNDRVVVGEYAAVIAEHFGGLRWIDSARGKREQRGG